MGRPKYNQRTLPVYRLCKRFTVESGHMLSKHPERCRYPHGHTRTIEVVVSSATLDDNGMVVDFKALKLAVKAHIDRYDHSMAVNSSDPLLPEMNRIYPDGVVVFENQEPTTEAMAKEIYDFISGVLKAGYRSPEGNYAIEAGRVSLQRVRVWETPTSWAEFGD